MSDYISEMTGDELQRNLRDAYGMTSALNREIEMLNNVRAEQAARIDDLEKLTGMMEQIRLHDEHVKSITAENAALRAQLAEAVSVLNDMHTEMGIVCEVGFDPERWAERMSALNKAGDVLGKHLDLVGFKA